MYSTKHTVCAEKPDRSCINVKKKLHKRFKKFIFWFLYVLYISALVFRHCILTIDELLHPTGHAGSRGRRTPGDDGIDGVPLGKGQDPSQGRLRQFELCDLTVLSPPELHCSPLGTILAFFSCSWVPLPSCYWLGKCERFYFIENAARRKVFILRQ